MNDLITVIIPVYNVEEYIERCVNSVVCQTYYELEIILVDDGSTDRSGELCDIFELNDNRIKVIHQRNGGLSKARNSGLQIAKGSYVTCIDSDDFVSRDFIESLYNAMKRTRSEIGISSFIHFYNDEVSSKPFIKTYSGDEYVMNTEEALKRMLQCDGFTHSAWGKLYKKELFEEIRYPEGRICEDLATTYKLILKSDRIVFLYRDLYFYQIRRGSIQNSEFTEERMDEYVFAIKQKEAIDEQYPSLSLLTQGRVVSSCFHILFLMDDFEDQKEICEQLISQIRNSRRRLISCKDVNRKIRYGCALSYMGLTIMRTIYQVLGLREKYLG